MGELMRTVIDDLKTRYDSKQVHYLYHKKETELLKKEMDELLEAINTLEFKHGRS